MRTVPAEVYLATGQSVRLGSPVAKGRGGEGTVVEVSGDPFTCAKLYHRPPGEAHVRKLALMVCHPPMDPALSQTEPHPSVVWPRALVFQGRTPSTCLGFLMPKVDLRVFHPVRCYFDNDELVQRFGGRFTWEHSLYIARNLASVMAAIHAKGYCVGDVNGSNCCAAPTGQVTVLDCDSFQVPDPAAGRLFRCHVGVDEYTAPEIQGQSFSDVDRTCATDTFALAVLLFQLLMNNTFPYAAIGPAVDDAPSTVEKIRKGLFPYPPGQKDVQPPPYAPPYTILPRHLAALFERCFRSGHLRHHVRPSALDWVKAFDRVLDKQTCPFRGCARNPYHRYVSYQPSCPWCDHVWGEGQTRPPISPVGRQRTTSGVVSGSNAGSGGHNLGTSYTPVPSIAPPPQPKANRRIGWGGVHLTWVISRRWAWVLMIVLYMSFFLGKGPKDHAPAPRESDLLYLADIGTRDDVARLVAKGAAVNQTNTDGWSPLVFAARNGDRNVVALLLDKGAAVNQATNDGWSPLMFAARNGHRDVVTLLVERGAAVNPTDEYGTTPLLLAAEYGHRDVVATLLEKGAVANQTDHDGWSPLIYAARNGYRDVVTLLLAKGAAVNLADRNGTTALLLPNDHGHHDVVAILRQNGTVNHQEEPPAPARHGIEGKRR